MDFVWTVVDNGQETDTECQEAAEPIYSLLMVSSVLWKFPNSTVKPVHPERKISPSSVK